MKSFWKVLPLLSVLVLAGCSSGTDSSSVAAGDSSSGGDAVSSTDSSTTTSTTTSDGEYTPVITEPVEIEIWTTIGTSNQTAFNTMLERVQELEPNITITNTFQNSMGYSDLHDAILQGFSANNYPDLAYCYPDHVADYINAGKAVNLEPYITDETIGFTDEDEADYIEAFLDEGSEYVVDGVYSLPFSKSTEGLYYNRGVLNGLNLNAACDALGIDRINDGFPLNDAYFADLTWEEFFERLCPALMWYNENDTELLDFSQSDTAILGYDSDDNLFITLAQQYGLGYTGINEAGTGEILFNNQGMKDLMTKFNEWANSGYIVSQGTTGSYTSNLFTANQCLFSVSSTAGVTYLWSTNTPDVAVAPIPHAEVGDTTIGTQEITGANITEDNYNQQISQGPSFCVLDKGDENRAKAAYVVWKLLTDETNCIEWSINTGYMGIRNSFYESAQYEAASNTEEQTTGTQDMLLARNWEYLPTVDDYVYTSPVFKGSADVRDTVEGLMTWTLATDTATFLANLDSQFDYYENIAKNAL